MKKTLQIKHGGNGGFKLLEEDGSLFNMEGYENPSKDPINTLIEQVKNVLSGTEGVGVKNIKHKFVGDHIVFESE